ncbi:MAG: hypothetical protein IJQ73_16075 [Kiritimatiellae bacterium]|nr:hypothetical protein [Kiritimatiellia bacterium]
MKLAQKTFCILHSAFCIATVAANAANVTLGTRVSFTAVIPNGENISVSLGRGKERLTLAAKGDAYAWNYLSPDGADVKSAPYPSSSRPLERMAYWWEHSEYTPNGRYRRSFSTPREIAEASEAMLAERWMPASERKLEIAVELADGWLSFWVDDILLHAVRATADMEGAEVKVAASKGVALSEQTAEPVKPAPGYWRVPLGRVASVDSELASAIDSFGGIPFLPSPRAVDIGKSWVREACADEYGEPHRGTFGGRWAGAMSATPCRLQFRVPNRRYSAMYLLASCSERNFLTVQFYRPGSGFPVDCLPAEPIATNGALQLVRVPLRQDGLATFADREVLEFELTGHVMNYRAHPEPLHYSRHGMGTPSGVKVHAITLEDAALEIDFAPEAFGNVWVGNPAEPAYLLTLRNRASADVAAEIEIRTKSYDGDDISFVSRTLAVPARDEAKIRLATPVKKYGWHSVSLKVNGERYERSLVVLRAREYKRRPFEAKGLMFGSWAPGTTHFCPPVYDACRLAFPLGIESFSHGNACKRTDIEPLARKYGARDFSASTLGTGRPDGFGATNLEERLRKTAAPESAVSDPSFQVLFAEPGGIGQEASITALCGESFEPRTEAEQEKYAFYKTNILHFSEVYRRVFPDKKLLMPWGSPLFTIAYLQDPDTRDKFDGMAFDTAFFDRLPEGQLHACSLYVLTLLNQAWRKYRDDTPVLTTVEAPCISREAPESLTPEEHLRNYLRSGLILAANGVTRQFSSAASGVEACSYWGEQHYNDGAFSRVTLNPHRLYAAMGTMVRLLRNCEFVRVVPAGSLGVFALEFRNAVTDKPLHALWCIRGKVPFTAKCDSVFDAMDNPTSTRFVTPAPIFMVGCKGEITFGDQVFDEADTKPAADAVDLGTLADWRQSLDKPDASYIDSMPDSIVRHPVEMIVERTGGKLSVCLPKGLPDKGPMPFCTTLVPPRPILLPGRPRILALDVTTEADWGRVVYVLRDAKGEKFTSVGKAGTFNVDDTKCDSYFNFSGTRLVRFELPGNQPWDGARLPGSCWWGTTGGDGRVDYPLVLEKIYVERRAKAMHVNDIADIAPTPALFGHLYAEGIDPASDLRMPLPSVTKRQNPIAALGGTLPPTEITGVTHPDHYYDGTRGHFAFREVEGASSYDIYVGLSPTGEGAILLKKGARKSGELVSGFLPDTDHYAFVVWHDANGAISKPSAPFKFRLRDEFAEK